MVCNEKKYGVALSYVQIILKNLIAIVCTPIIIRLLGQNQYGLFQLASSLIVYLGILNCGLSATYIRYYSIAEKKNDNSRYLINGIFLLVLSFLALITLFIGLVVIFNFEYIFSNGLSSKEYIELKIICLIMLLNLVISFPIGVFFSNLILNEKFIYQRCIDIIFNCLSEILTIVVLFCSHNLIFMILSTVFLNLVKYIFVIFYCMSKLNMKFMFNNIEFKIIKDIFIFSLYIFLGLLVDQLNWNIDKFILGRFKNTSEVAIYSIGAQLNSYFITFGSAISAVFIPKANRIVSNNNNNNELLKLMIKIGRIQYFVLMFLLLSFVFFGKYFIKLWIGEEYYTSYYIGLILILPVIIPCIQNIGIEIQKAQNKHKFRSLIYFFIALVNLIISIYLCNIYGSIGCAVGTFISIFLGNVILMNWYYHKKMNLNMIIFWKSILKCFVSMIFPILLGCFLTFYIGIRNIIEFIIYFIVFSIIYAICIYNISFNIDEKKMFMLIIKEKYRK